MLQNSIILLLLTLLCFGLVVLTEKMFGKEGLFAYLAIATIISNILAAAVGPMMGLHGVTLANVPFATIFLVGNILSTCYSEEDAKKGVYVTLYAAVAFLSIMMLCSYLIPEPYDVVSSNIKFLFGFGSYNMCNTVASVIMFFIANMFSVKLFNKLRRKLEDKHLWLANNVATIVANCLENFAFVLLGLFVFPNVVLALFPTAFDASLLMSIKDCLMIALTTCIFEFVLALVDTPFLYLAIRVHWGKEE